MPEFNINQMVKVKLTDLGRTKLREDHIKFWAASRPNMPYRPKAEDAEGWSTWQLWQLMADLGPYLSLGFDLVIETTILFEPFE